MAESQQINSILAADIGSVNTRAVLIDVVDGAYRLVARGETRSTVDDPYRDAGVGLRRALKAITEQTGRRLLTEEEEIMLPERGSGIGVDQFVATASAGRPLRVALAGLMPDVSIASARRALAGSYVEVTDTLSLADIRTEEQQINDLLAHKPDMIFIVGGTDAGAEEAVVDLARVVRTAVRLVEGRMRPTVLYAGNRTARHRVSEILEEEADLYLADNVRPSLMDEKLGAAQQELAAVFDHLRKVDEGGFEEISNKSLLGVLPTAHSFNNVVGYIGEQAADAGVLAVDLGSATTTLAASMRRQPYISIRSDIGIGHSVVGTLEATTMANVRRWLTWDASDDEIVSYVRNKALRPASVPQTEQDLELEYALAREAIRVMMDGARAERRLWDGDNPADLGTIIGSGAVLAKAPHAGLAALILLDAIQPVGVSDLWLDTVGLIPALGAIAYVLPPAVVQVIDAGDLLRVGSAVCAEGEVPLKRIGRGGMKVKITLESGQVEEKQVHAGTLWTYPLPPGETAEVDVRLSRGLTVNGKSRVRVTLEGGAAGLIFDVRGRPLPLSDKAEVRARLYPRWAAGTRGELRLRIDQVDASAVDAEALAEAQAAPETGAPEPFAVEAGAEVAEPKRRRGLFGRRRQAEPVPDIALEDAPTIVARVEEPAQAPEEEAPKPRRGLFGRRRKQVEPEVAEEAAPAAEADEMTAILDDLRLGGEEEAAPSGRRRRRR